jgi:cathepsin X/AP endonuclease-2
MNIVKNGMGNVVMLSRQTFVNCGPERHYGNGCGGGGVHEVLGYLKDYGLPDDTCQIWTAQNGECNALGQCGNCFPGNNGTSNCWPVKPYTVYRLKGYNLIDVADPKERAQAIMSEIYSRGPVTCGIYTSDVFDFNYFGGVWTQENEEFDHDIEVVGWGTDNGVDYWHIRNSWGTYWGESGFFRIKRGLDRGLVEYDCWFGVPDVSEEDRLYPHGSLAGSMVGLIDRGAMIINLQKQTPLVEPQPPVSTQILVTERELDSIQVDAPPSALAVVSTATRLPSGEHSSGILWLSILALFGALGVYAIANKLKGQQSSYDPINDL